MDKVLVLDGDMIPALAVARSLIRRGLQVVVASHEPKPLAGYARGVSSVELYPDPMADEPGFLDWAAPRLDAKGFRLIIPVTERTVVPLLCLADHPSGDRIAMASSKSLRAVLDKQETMALAETLGISAPRSLLVEQRSDLAGSCENLFFPVVVKPARSIGASEGERKQLKVEYAFSENQLVTMVLQYLRFGPVLLQEYVRGTGVGVELIADRGKVQFAFQHRRLHEVPLTGGGSSLRVSEAVEPELMNAACRLISALDWHGVAMVEFKWDAHSRRYFLMEINGRFWGSLPLAVAAGADFPAMLYELYETGRLTPRPPAREGIFCRRLSADITWHELVFRREGLPELVQFPSGIEILRDWMRIVWPRHHFDVQQWRDPLPGIVDFARIIRVQFARLVRAANSKRLLWMHQLAWNRGVVHRATRDARRFLFVCYGNINRSPLAECLFRSLVPDKRIGANSAGFHVEENRAADPIMIEVASARGIDLKNWSSRCLTSEMIDESDIVFVMELEHYVKICKLFPQACGKTYILSAGSNVRPEIRDPYGRSRASYEECASHIYSCIENLITDL